MRLHDRPRTSLRAAAEVVRSRTVGTEAGREKRKIRAEQWQSDAIQCATDMGEIGMGYEQKGNAAAKCRLFIAYRPERDAEPVPADDQAGFSEANDALNRLDENSPFGLPGILKELVVNLDVPGECYIVGEYLDENGKPLKAEDNAGPVSGIPAGAEDEGEVVPEGTPERWDVRSVLELTKKQGSREEIKERESDRGRPLSHGGYVGRIWLPSPWYSQEAMSPMRWVLERCEEFLLLSRGVRARGRSRIPAGMLALPTGTKLVPPTPMREGDTDGEDVDPEELLLEVMMAPIEDEASAAALVPILAFLPPDVWEKFGKDKFVTFDRPLDKDTLEERDRVRRWIMESLNFPTEYITGMDGLNHWTAWQIWGSSFPLYTEPTVQLACHGLTEAYLKPMLRQAGVDPGRLLVWYDAAALTVRPNEVKDTMQAARIGAVGLEFVRDAIGATDDDKPTEKDLQTIERLLGRSAPPDDGTTMGQPIEGPSPEAASRRALVAAGRRSPLGAQLLAIDRDLRARLEAAASQAMNHALSRAGARIRSSVTRDRSVTASASQKAIENVCNRDVAWSLGRSIVAALGFGENEVMEGTFEDFGDQYRAWVQKAQGRTLSLLVSKGYIDEDEAQEIALRQDEDREASWAWLLPALIALASERLYDPNPSAPPVGEHDSSLDVPTGTVREAMARAGGAPGAVGTGGPTGGIATGQRVTYALQSKGLSLEGWRWVWGGSERAFPPHEDLDGYEFTSWTDERMAVPADYLWLGVGFFVPGDHAGCSCDFEPVWSAPGAALGESEAA